MARKNPVPPEKIEEGRRVRVLREGLKIPRTTFATMCGLTNNLFEAKETGKVPFRHTELLRIKEVAKKHLMDGLTSFHALPF